MAQREPPSFAALLRSYRRAAGLSQEALAEQAGISARAISDLERGLYQAPRRDTVSLLVAALGLAGPDAARLESAVPRRRRKGLGAPAARSALSRTAAGGRWPDPPRLRLAYTADRPPARTVLPVSLTSLIGREDAVAEVTTLLADPRQRLVTLIGPAGVGKTRLALHLGAAAASEFEGVVFVPLETVLHPDLVLPAVAQAAAVDVAPGEAWDGALADAWQSRRVLLILDNFEQVVAASTQVAGLLSAAPGVTALVTSRAALRVRGERLFPVTPLAEPASVRLFLERARATSPEHVPGPQDAATISDICRRLDGLPLAIELAAARTRLLAPQDVLTRLSRPLTLLTGGPRDLPERHQALEAAIAWSYDLLAEDERALFRRLAVFAGGCTVEAAVAVCPTGGGLASEPLDGLQALIDHSLIRREVETDPRPGQPASTGARLRLLETLREFGLNRLVAAGERAALEGAHARYFLDLAERAERELIGPTLELWLDRLEREHDNLRRAMRWAIEADEPVVALRLGAALSRFWSLRGHFREGWRWLEAALALPGSGAVAPRVLARAVNAAGILALTCNEYRRADALFEQALVAARAAGDVLLLAEALNSAGGAARARGDAASAVALFEEALALPGVAAFPRTVAHTMFSLAMVARDRQDVGRAESLLQRCLDVRRSLDDRQGTAVTLNILASVAFASGDRSRARTLHEEGLAIQEAIGHKRGVAVSLAFMCAEAATAGDVAGTADLCRRALRACREIGERWNTAECLASLARVSRLQGRWEEAVRLLGAAAHLRGGGQAPREHRAAEAALLDAARVRLDESRFAARWAEGAALGFDGAVDLGLAIAGATRRRQRSAPQRARPVKEARDVS
jgi:predicted ATPase/DNA-binding XRE family transcriptional regulator